MAAADAVKRAPNSYLDIERWTCPISIKLASEAIAHFDFSDHASRDFGQLSTPRFIFGIRETGTSRTLMLALDTYTTNANQQVTLRPPT